MKWVADAPGTNHARRVVIEVNFMLLIFHFVFVLHSIASCSQLCMFIRTQNYVCGPAYLRPLCHCWYVVLAITIEIKVCIVCLYRRVCPKVPE